MNRRASLLLLCSLSLAACVSGPGQFAKTDIDRIADEHRRAVGTSLARLAEKLYRRNPREWRKGGHVSLEIAMERLVAPSLAGGGADAEGLRSTVLILAGLREDYPHDRVAAFVGGLSQMLHDAFEGKFEFFLFDDLDPQKLYNAARNVEIAAWKLGDARRTRGEADLPAGSLLLLSNEMAPVRNLSFEREFGRLIGNLDLLSRIVADKNQRTVVKVVQNLATSVFLPI
jgi:hypothetical protein